MFKSKCKNSNVEVTAVFNTPVIVECTEIYLTFTILYEALRKSNICVVGRVLLGWLCVTECPLLVALSLQPLLIFTEGGTYNVQTL